MTTQEDRIAALEQKVADIELERLYERSKAIQGTPSEQTYDIKQVNHRLTMLLGIASGQEGAIQAIKEDMDLRFDVVGRQIAELKQSTDHRFDSMDQKFDKVLQLLTAITNKLGAE